ncbi:MAG: hypothetical protein HZA08_13705 [Nitrospirae bacterium]|nr:hypothetical protein [Nitrospirota bacterium]
MKRWRYKIKKEISCPSNITNLPYPLLVKEGKIMWRPLVRRGMLGKVPPLYKGNPT